VCTYTPSKRRARAAATEATAGSLLRTATVYYDHPVHTPALHTLNIDFANPAEGAPAPSSPSLRTVVDPGGQMINATDMLPVMAEISTMIVWGGRDRLIRVQHGRQAHRAIPNSRLEIFPKAGHFPHLDEPRWFAGLLVDFVGQTEDRLVQTAVPPATDRRVPALAAT
jgi:pimeloyl-ACP methyl ester carboxylesterase